jgi:20S proteasome subunit beta 4
MDSLFGFVGNGYVLMAADASAARSIIVFKNDHDKIMQLDERKLLGASGTMADNENFGEFIQKNLKLYSLNNDLHLSTSAAANYIRNELAVALRKGPFQTNVLLGGMDKIDATKEDSEFVPSLYWMDYLAAMSKVNFGSQGHCSNFLLAVFDREYPVNNPESLSEEAGIELAKKCIQVLHTRFLPSQPNFIVKILDKNGTRVIKL